MATLALGAIGSSIGSTILPAIGGISGAALGQAAGALAGRYVDEALFAPSGQKRPINGPRLQELDVTSSTEGQPIPRIYGRTRISGEMIWATRFEEEIITRTQSTGQASSGKGGSSSSGSTTRTDYRYYANFAIALSEGTITRLGRVWANGNDLSLSDYTYRLYRGDETQNPDSLIEAKEGTGGTPAYRGIAYIVFERMPLASFGNRIPQLKFEIFRRLDDFEQTIEAMCLIPSAGEYVYEPAELTRDLGQGKSTPENTHTHQGNSDWTVSLDQMQEEIPNIKNISLFVSWFGDDLRVDQCQLRPAVDNRDKVILGRSWAVSGEVRSSAKLISLDDGRPAYGGTPSDETIINAITDLKARGLGVTFTPFILMDVPEENSLGDPYTGNPYQPKYPWRGRITVSPAPGEPGTPDKTSLAQSNLANFIGTASPVDFAINGNEVIYTGPTEWSLRRMLLHYANLCAAAGGVDSFVLGSELRGLTTIRDEANNYPFVTALETLAGEIKTILGASTKLTYAADWSEYFGHQPTDGTGDVFFHLDPLWSSENIDAIGIDCYWPLSDWRAGNAHIDAVAGHSLYDLDYLQGNIKGGEGFDWYYATTEDRDSQTRTPINDGAGKPWIYRYKDIGNWWANSHYNRPAGVEAGVPTSWTPQSKPIWLMETGCPAVHFASNQPNLFVDPKSSESDLPYYSDGSRDDYIQRRYITAMKNHFTPGSSGFEETNNPQSSQYSGRMVDTERIYVYTWDARAYPAFPANEDVWGDGENWLRGHWLNGRTGAVSLAALINRIMLDYDYNDFEAPALNGIIEGYMIDNIMSARDALQPLELAFFFDSFESEASIKFRHRGSGLTGITISSDDLVDASPERSLYEITRRQETELPRAAKINFLDANRSYQTRAVEGQQTIGQSKRIASANLPIVMEAEKVQSIANKWVQESWAAREQSRFALPRKYLALEPSDIITLNLDESSKTFRITEINDQAERGLESLTIDPDIYDDTIAVTALPKNTLPEIYGPTKALFLDLPLMSGNETEHAGYIGAIQSPWPGEVAFYRSSEDGNYGLNQTIIAPARSGVLLADLENGPIGRWDYANSVRVQMERGELSSSSKISTLGGANLAAIRHDNGYWEVIQFENTSLVGEKEYELSGLLRAQAGTDDALTAIASAGAEFLMLDEAIRGVHMSLNEVNLTHFWRYGPAPYAIGHPAYQTLEIAFEGRGLRPFSPVHLKGEGGGGDLVFSWIRRSRIGGDNWTLGEIPLGETSEQYVLEILDGGNPIRTESITSPEYTYSALDQISDWGSPQSAYHIRVSQLSEIYGKGSSAEALISNE